MQLHHLKSLEKEASMPEYVGGEVTMAAWSVAEAALKGGEAGRRHGYAPGDGEEMAMPSGYVHE